jgi:Ca-activated chloride channel family protein
VLDRSGSMSGDAMTEARRALSLCLRHLRPGDRFAILSFDTAVERLAAEPTVFSQRSLVAADAFLANVDARGGTELLAPLREAVTLAGTGGHVVLLTDGEVGNEDEIEREIVPRAQTAGVAIHAFAIGLNVSDTLLATLARQSGGALAHIYPGERIDEKVVQVFARATSPRVRDLTLTIEGVELADLAPATLPPYVDGEPFTLFGRYTVPGQGSVVLRGRLGASSYVRRVALTLPAQAESRTVPLCWAKTRLRDLEESPREGRRGEAMKRRIVELATRFQLASSETSFVVVEKRNRDRQVTAAAVARSIPVHAPATHAGEVAAAIGGARGGSGGGGFGGSVRSMSMAAPLSMSASDFAFDGSAGAPPAPAPAMAAPPPPPPPPPGARAASPAKKMAPPPAPQGGAQEATRPARPVTPKAPSPAPVRAREASFDAEQEDAFEASEGAVSSTSAARLLETQRAGGLFGADDGQVALTTTIDVLRACLAEGITTSHAIYGEQIKRALDAAVTLLDGPASDDKRALAALLVLLAEGRLTSRHIRAELAARASAAAVIAALDDTAALRLLAGGSA